ncbi:hypothetical protein FI667_g7481, partial [Globisporangium splendens]
MPEGKGSQDGTTATPSSNAETIYHVRLIQAWPLEPSSLATPQEIVRSQYSFFGLQLELLGCSSAGSDASSPPIALPLQFKTSSNDQDEQLDSLVGPYQIRVRARMAPTTAASEHGKLVLQKFIAVQPDNFLLEINSVHFLKSAKSAKDVFRSLLRVLTKISVAKPFELTFQRHNHPQAAAKILPFAMRADVQVAQVAQHQKMQEQEAQLSEAIKRKKQFITQQMDYEEEHYLYGHIGMQLFHLHEEIMANGQWQAYEFDQALWYYHATTNKLFAEHPMRNSEKTRQLIGTVQLKTRFAAQKLQRAARLRLRRKEIANAVIDRGVFENVWVDLWDQLWENTWVTQFAPLLVSSPLYKLTPKTVDEEVVRLLTEWKTPASKKVSPASSKWPTLADIARNGIPVRMQPSEKAVNLKSETNECVVSQSDKVNRDPTTSNDANKNENDSKEPLVDPDIMLPPSSSIDNVPESVSPLSPLDTAPQADQSNDSKHNLTHSRSNESLNDPNHDDEDSDSDWRGYLTLLKTNLKQKKASPPKRRQHIQEEDHAYSRLPRSSDLSPFTYATGKSMEYDYNASYVSLPSALPYPIASSQIGSPLKASKHLPAPMTLKQPDSFSDIDSWQCSGSFRAFHSFFARNLEDTVETNDIPIRERVEENPNVP